MINGTEESIDKAISTFRDFVSVQKQNSQAERLQAVGNFAQASGLTEPQFDYICGELSDLIESPGGELGWAIVGWMLGMLTAQYEQEKNG